MKSFFGSGFFLGFCIIIVMGCNHNSDKNEQKIAPYQKPEVRPFPVTDYLLGQIKQIEDKPVTLLKVDTQNGLIDSSWINVKQIQSLAQDFLSPVIDSVLLTKYFDGSSFEDLTINAATFTYSIKPESPKNLKLEEVTVYVNKDDGKINRVYLLKSTNSGEEQLTWKPDDGWFSIRNIEGNKVNEEKVIWDFGK